MSCTVATYRLDSPIDSPIENTLFDNDARGSISGGPVAAEPVVARPVVARPVVAGPSRKHILKLRVLNSEGSPQIRRVRLPQIQVNSKICFSALVFIAIKYTFPGTSVVLNNYDVIFTYYDIDNDCVTISSTKELVDAIGQFSSKKDPNICLRISAHVKEKSSLQIKKSDVPYHHKMREKQNETENNLKKPRDFNVTAPPQNIVESFVSAFTKIVNNLQNQKDSKNKDITSVKNIADVKKEVSISKTEKRTKTQHIEKSKRLFLHCRHTCDECQVTPIVGNRYHAINVADFDLCSVCRKNYTGDNKFEIVELERDRKFQDRWYKKLENLPENDKYLRNKVCSQ